MVADAAGIDDAAARDRSQHLQNIIKAICVTGYRAMGGNKFDLPALFAADPQYHGRPP